VHASFEQVDFVPLPPRFAGRVRIGSVVVGCSLLLGMLLLFGLTAFVNAVVHGHPFPDALIAFVAQLLGPLCVVATAVVVFGCRRCLRGDYLVVAAARTTRVALIVCYTATIVVTLFAVVLPLFVRVWRDEPLARTADLFGIFASLAFGTMGFAAGMVYVKPSLATLRKFSDHPIW